MKKRIGISFTKPNFKNYWNWFIDEDLQNNIELVELSDEKNNSEDIETCDAFILTGGVDIDPSFYNEKNTYKNKPAVFEIKRDEFEKKIFEYSQTHHLPLLGICRGMQLVNVLQGGKLIQDLGLFNEIHKKEQSDKEHEVKIEKDSLLCEIVAENIGKVNSAHHQAVDRGALGENLMINAYSNTQEKTIEGIEFKDKTGKAFMLCVQWHPERMNDKESSSFSKNIKEKFLEEVRK
jgi:putative glutamine amidotransferase